MLFTFIGEGKWTEVVEILTSNPKDVYTWVDGILPIHDACCDVNIPVKVIEALINAFPKSLGKETTLSGETPLHISVRSRSHVNYDVVKVLLQNYKKAASAIDFCGRTPLHSYLWYSPFPSLKIVNLLLEAYPEAVHITDGFGGYPLHCAAKCGNWDISKHLIRLFPNALVAQSSSGMTPKDVANDSGNSKLAMELYKKQQIFCANFQRLPTILKENYHNEEINDNSTKKNNQLRQRISYRGISGKNKLTINKRYSSIEIQENTLTHIDLLNDQPNHPPIQALF